MSQRRTLVIMLKAPRPGQVKTRLARDIGTIPALWWYRHQTARLIRRLAHDPRWQVVLQVSPDTQTGARIWPARLIRRPQGRGDLGARMRRAFQMAGGGPTLIIGSDIPGIRPDLIWSAFRAFGQSDAVIGPAPDGGYWLIGLRRSGRATPKRLFANVRWSGPHARLDTRASLPGAFRVSEVQMLRDVDCAADLEALGRT